jgi:acyl-CoA synthetase (AMP-forming)/AMP-acid ligase II
MAKASPEFTIPPTDPEDMSCLHFTSGTTGMPKGAIHVHKAVMIYYMTANCALDMHEDDGFWCTADPGWVTGTSYGIIALLLHGVTNIVNRSVNGSRTRSGGQPDTYMIQGVPPIRQFNRHLPNAVYIKHNPRLTAKQPHSMYGDLSWAKHPAYFAQSRKDVSVYKVC